MRNQVDKIYAGGIGKVTARREGAKSFVLSASPGTYPKSGSNAGAADRLERAPLCPACSQAMQPQRRRLFACAPCRQTIETFDVVEHRYLIFRQPSIKPGPTISATTKRDECGPDRQILSGKKTSLSPSARAQTDE